MPHNKLGRLSCLVLGLLVSVPACPSPKPDDDLDYQRGLNALAQNRSDWARFYYQRDYARHPERLDSLRQAGLSWLSGYQQSLSTAIRVLQRYITLQPDDDETKLRLARALLLIGEGQAARDLALRLEDSPAALLFRAEAFLDVDLAVAQLAIERVLAAAHQQPSEHSARVHAIAAQIYSRTDQSSQALQHAQEAVSQNPFDAQTWYLLGRLWRQAGKPDAARHALETQQLVRQLLHDGTITPLSPSDELMVLRQLAPRVAADGVVFRTRKLKLLLQTGKLEKAVAEVEHLLDQPNTAPSQLAVYAKWAHEHGLRSLSQHVFERILAAQPSHTGARASLAWLALQRGELDTAQSLLESGLVEQPFFARYLYLLGRVASARDDVETARAYMEQALTLAPWEWAWRLDLADLLLAQGRQEEFRQLLNAAPETHPALEQYRQRYGQILGVE